MDNNNEAKRLSRRNFLKGIPIGIAGVLAIKAVSGSPFSRKESRYPKFPEGSIFKPANDRTDL